MRKSLECFILADDDGYTKIIIIIDPAAPASQIINRRKRFSPAKYFAIIPVILSGLVSYVSSEQRARRIEASRDYRDTYRDT